MNLRSLIAAVAVLCAASAYAQRTYEPAVPRGVTDQRVEPTGELAAPMSTPAPAPVPPRLVQNETRSNRDADARHCLSRTANKDIHRCAQPYLGRSARARVRKASVKTPAPAPAVRTTEAPKPAETLKPGAAKPADTARAADLVKPMDVTKSGGTPKTVEAPTARPPEAGKAIPSAESAANRLNLPRIKPGADPTAAK